MATEEAAWKRWTAKHFDSSEDESEAAVPVDTNIVHSRKELCEICHILLFEPAMYMWQDDGSLEYLQRSPKCPFCRFIIRHGALVGLGGERRGRLSKDLLITSDPTLNHGFIEFGRMFGPRYRFPFWRSGADRRSSLKETPNANVDFAEIKEWLQVCEASHGGLCARERIANLSGLRLINCMTRTISNAPKECKYVALSYLWGKPATKTTSSTPDYLPSPAPQVIEDALVVTMELGFLYLWVDRYCIDQDDVDTKHELIQNMDKIYNTAKITIIDAVGDSPDFGLAGVSRPRSALKCFQVEDYRIFFVPNTRKEVSESPWSTRGWTFQEGVLSHRRLIFTKSHTYLHCQTKARRLQQELGMSDVADPGTLVFPEKGIGSGIEGLRRHIQHYFNRDLTFDSDVIEAFHGVLNAFQNMNSPVYNFWGLPFEYTKLEMSALESLLWILERDFTKESFVERRQGIPSWTWAGWKTSYSLNAHKFSSEGTNILPSIQLRTLEGEMVSLGSYVTNNCRNLYNPSLHLTSWIGHVRLSETFDDCIVSSPRWLSKTVHVELVIDDRTKAMIQDHLDKRSRWKYMFIGTSGNRTYVIIIRPVDGKSDTYTRLGVITMASINSRLEEVHDEANEVLTLYDKNNICSTECSTECDQHEKEVLRKESIILV